MGSCEGQDASHTLHVPPPGIRCTALTYRHAPVVDDCDEAEGEADTEGHGHSVAGVGGHTLEDLAGSNHGGHNGRQTRLQMDRREHRQVAGIAAGEASTCIMCEMPERPKAQGATGSSPRRLALDNKSHNTGAIASAQPIPIDQIV